MTNLSPDIYGTTPYITKSLEGQGIVRDVQVGNIPEHHGPLIDYVIEAATESDPTQLEGMYFVNMDMFMKAVDSYAEDLVARVSAGNNVNIILTDRFKSPDWMTAIILQKAEQKIESLPVLRRVNLKDKVKIYYTVGNNLIFEPDQDGKIPFVENQSITYDDNVISGKKYRQHMEHIQTIIKNWTHKLEDATKQRLYLLFGEDDPQKLQEKVYEYFIKNNSFFAITGVYPNQLPQPRLSRIYYGCKDYKGIKEDEGKPSVAVVTDWKVVDYGVAHKLGLETNSIYRIKENKGMSEEQTEALSAFAAKYNLPQIFEAGEYISGFMAKS